MPPPLSCRRCSFWCESSYRTNLRAGRLDHGAGPGSTWILALGPSFQILMAPFNVFFWCTCAFTRCIFLQEVGCDRASSYFLSCLYVFWARACVCKDAHTNACPAIFRCSKCASQRPFYLVGVQKGREMDLEKEPQPFLRRDRTALSNCPQFETLSDNEKDADLSFGWGGLLDEICWTQWDVSVTFNGEGKSHDSGSEVDPSAWVLHYSVHLRVRYPCMSDSLGWQMSWLGVLATAKIVKTWNLELGARGTWSSRSSILASSSSTSWSTEVRGVHGVRGLHHCPGLRGARSQRSIGRSS